MTDSLLHERLLARITERRQLAEALNGGGETWTAFRYIVGTANNGDVASTWPDASGRTATFIADNDPAQILRDCDAHLKILERHRRRPDSTASMDLLRDHCTWCARRWPCPDVEDLAGSYPEENQ